MKDPDFLLKQTIGFHNDPEMDEHIDMMVWFALRIIFIESAYIYFNTDQHETNNKIL